VTQKSRLGFDPKGVSVAITEQGPDRLRLTIAHPPTVNDSYIPVIIARRASIAMSRTGSQFKAYIAAGLEKRCTPIGGTLSVSLRSVGSRTDIDGCIKVTLDSLQGFAYPNDRMVRRLAIEKLPADGGLCPRLEVTVETYAPGDMFAEGVGAR
jgi:Holliday junction resolvase RusA-like endonuclease